MHGNGEKTIDKKFNGSSRLIATNYACLLFAVNLFQLLIKIVSKTSTGLLN